MMIKWMTRAGIAMAWAGVLALTAAQAAPITAEHLHARAVASFQHGRYAEAYGRFMALADAGYAPSADVALFMYSNGATLFGSHWDVSPEQLATWAELLGRPVPLMVATPARPAQPTRRQ
jgi:hypothetical protein